MNFSRREHYDIWNPSAFRHYDMGIVGVFMGRMLNVSRGYKCSDNGNIRYYKAAGPITRQEYDEEQRIEKSKNARKRLTMKYKAPFSYPPHPDETRQQRRLRERNEAKMESNQLGSQSQKGYPIWKRK